MKINCDVIIHSKAVHLNQIFSGFIELHKKGLINANLIKKEDSIGEWTEIILNNSIRAIYDTYDSGHVFAPNVDFNKVDYYFKRSYDHAIVSQISDKIRPLGLNYDVLSKTYNTDDFKTRTKKMVKRIVRNKKATFYVEDFEYYPNISTKPKVCFLTRMWDTSAPEIENENVRQERVEINQFRAACIRSLREEFGKNFIGGIENSKFARDNFSDCIVGDSKITNRATFLNLLKTDIDIAIATTGLHRSIGWKFGEYVAAARAIVSEKLHYELPGDFEENKNYLTFSSVDELVRNVNLLISNQDIRLEMMKSNYRYYNNFVRPDSLIMNTLIQMKASLK